MQIRHVQFGSVIANIARLENGVEVIPMPEVYNLLGISQHNISQHLDNFISPTDSIPENSISDLKRAGIISSGRGRPPRLITKEEFQFLVKKVNTPQAWSVYQSLWGIVENYVQASDAIMPAWAIQMQEGISRLEIGLQDTKDICRGLRDEVDELQAIVGLLFEDSDRKLLQAEIKYTKQKLECDGRKLVGLIKAQFNTNSIYGSSREMTMRIVRYLKQLRGDLRVIEGGKEEEKT